MTTLIRKPADPARADVLRGERSPHDGEVVESSGHRHTPGYRFCDRCGCQAPVCDTCHQGWRGGHGRPTTRIRKAAKG
jgi:hypothetical protein